MSLSLPFNIAKHIRYNTILKNVYVYTPTEWDSKVADQNSNGGILLIMKLIKI